MFDDEPLWFPSDELLTSVLHAEINAVMQLLAKHSDLPDLFDTPDGTVPQRSTCFAMLAHRKLIETISNTLAGRQIQPALNDEESHTLRCIYNLVADDAPAWALEMQRVIDRLPAHIYASLPEPLRRGGYNPDDTEQMKAIKSAKKILSTVEQIQTLTERVINQQLQRLVRRWPTMTISTIGQSHPAQHSRTTTGTLGRQTRRLNKRKGWEQKLKLCNAIQQALSRKPSLEGIEFCSELDKRHAPPLYDWLKTGEWREGLTWKEAWASRRLRKKIRRVRQEAMKAI